MADVKHYSILYYRFTVWVSIFPRNQNLNTAALFKWFVIDGRIICINLHLYEYKYFQNTYKKVSSAVIIKEFNISLSLLDLSVKSLLEKK